MFAAAKAWARERAASKWTGEFPLEAPQLGRELAGVWKVDLEEVQDADDGVLRLFSYGGCSSSR